MDVGNSVTVTDVPNNIAALSHCSSGCYIVRRVLSLFLDILSSFADRDSTPLRELAGGYYEGIQS